MYHSKLKKIKKSKFFLRYFEGNSYLISSYLLKSLILIDLFKISTRKNRPFY